MALLEILTHPNPKLRNKAQPVAAVDADVRKLMDDMLETMYAENGVGLAAIQVGVAKRVIVADCADAKAGEAPAPYKLANPEIIEAADETCAMQEGCLSVPGVFNDVVRPERVKIKALDYNNKEIILEVDGLLGACLQHEIDHLDGGLFIDRLSKLKRDMTLKKYAKLQAEPPAHHHGHYHDDGSYCEHDHGHADGAKPPVL